MNEPVTWLGHTFEETLIDTEPPAVPAVFIVVRVIPQPPGYTRAPAYTALYVGQTDNLRDHLQTHLEPELFDGPGDALDPKATALHWRALSDPASRAALAAELIRALAPPMNRPE